MAEFSSNYSLYKWQAADQKQETLIESAKNADKIDAALTEINQKAEDAHTKANYAGDTALDAQITSQTASNTAYEAKGIAEEANSTANEAAVTANEAKTTASDAKTTASTVSTEFNRIVAEAGSNNPEVVQARGGEVNLNSRMNKVTNKTAEVTSSIRQGYYKGALVSFAFDDGSKKDITNFKPIFQSENVPGCACLITNIVGTSGYMTWEEAKELKAMGWTVASHTHTHINVDNVTESVIDFEYRESQRLLKENGLDYDIIVYPYGATSETSFKIARKYYKMGVDIVRGLSNLPPKIDNYRVNRVAGLSQTTAGIGTEPTLAQCKTMIDQAVISGEWLVFEDHSAYAIWDSLKLEELRQLIQYIKSLGIPIVNLQDGFNMRCNVIDTEGYKVHRNGMTQNRSFEDYSYDATTPITYFPYGETKTFFANNQITGKGFPTNYGGTVTTFRPSNKEYYTAENLGGYQTFRRYNTVDLYFRIWISGDKWSDWYRVPTVLNGNSFHMYNATLNAYTGATAITGFPADAITTFGFNSANSTGFPTNAGIITTYRIAFGNGWNKQECRQYNGHNLWTRYVLTDGTWSEWKLLTSFNINPTLNAYTAANLIAEFPSDSVTTFHVNTASATGLPDNTAGTVTTYKIGTQAGYYKQEYRKYRSNEVWSRLVDEVTGGWQAWVKISAI